MLSVDDVRSTWLMSISSGLIRLLLGLYLAESFAI